MKKLDLIKEWKQIIEMIEREGGEKTKQHLQDLVEVKKSRPKKITKVR